MMSKLSSETKKESHSRDESLHESSLINYDECGLENKNRRSLK